jgi:ribonuclease BN (tRNA processing enzyme)
VTRIATTALLAAALAGAAWSASGDDQERTRLVLLGTRGGPRVDLAGRANASTLLVIGGEPYVVDCGYGCTRQLLRAGVALKDLRYVFITHHHSDHELEYGPLFYNAWVGGLATRVLAFGPPGLERMTEAFFEYMKADVETRVPDEGRPDPRPLLVARDVEPGVVLQNARVKVTAGLVRHPPFARAYAYRFDAKDRSVVISGDTTYSPELVELARGADVLVHEVFYPPAMEALLSRTPTAARLREHLQASHATPEDVGRVAAQAGVKTLVLSHFVPGDDAAITDAQWTEGVRKHFAGRTIVGTDLLEVP